MTESNDVVRQGQQRHEQPERKHDPTDLGRLRIHGGGRAQVEEQSEQSDQDGQ